VDRLSLAKIDPEGKPWGQLMTAFAIVIRRIDGLTAPNSEQDFTPNKNQADIFSRGGNSKENGIRVFASEAEAKTLVELSRRVGK
jgi:hypothetical protein